MTADTDVLVERAGLDRPALLRMLRAMLLTRETDDRIRTLYLQGKISGGVYSQVGHEAISVGTASALRPDDVLAPMHRDLGAHLVRGMDLGRIFAQILGRATGYTGGRDNALHIGDLDLAVLPQISMLGTSIPVAAGAALAIVQAGEDRVALTYVGDGAINTGDFHEGLNFAAVLRLPFVLIVENNQYAYSTPVSRQVALATLAERAAGYGIPGVRVDGNDVLAVFAASQEAVQRARAGDGPTLIECVTMRMRGHSENDDARYVPPELLAQWRDLDPITGCERWLLERGLLDEQDREGMREAVVAEVRAAADWAESQPMPDATHGLGTVYSDGDQSE